MKPATYLHELIPTLDHAAFYFSKIYAYFSDTGIIGFNIFVYFL